MQQSGLQNGLAVLNIQEIVNFKSRIISNLLQQHKVLKRKPIYEMFVRLVYRYKYIYFNFSFFF